MTLAAISPSTSVSERSTTDVIAVRALERHYPVKAGVFQRVVSHVRAVDGVDLAIRRGETLALVGESGCGKSTLARCIGGLERPTAGGVYYELPAQTAAELDRLLAGGSGTNGVALDRRLAQIEQGHEIGSLSRERWRAYRRNCQMVFQDIFASLNPRQLVKDIVGRPLRIHDEASGDDLLRRVVELLESVGLGREHLFRYPHQFSGGQRQRISIARALALQPDLLVLDEPTSALDVSVQAQILNLLEELQVEFGLTYLFISHDLGVVHHMADRIAVMYQGKLVELGSTEAVFDSPKHPYTEALLAANPDLADQARIARTRLDGPMPDPTSPPAGCRLHTRCPVSTPACGWELEDVLCLLDRDASAPEVVTVERRSAFEGELAFGDESAAAAAAGLVERAPAALRGAIEDLRREGKRLLIRLREVEPVRLEQVGDGHLSSCLLHAPAPGSAERS